MKPQTFTKKQKWILAGIMIFLMPPMIFLQMLYFGPEMTTSQIKFGGRIVLLNLFLASLLFLYFIADVAQRIELLKKN